MRYYEINEAIGRRGFLQGLGAAAGLGAVGYGAVQQKQRPWSTPEEPTRDGIRSVDVPTQPGGKSAPAAAKPGEQKYSPEILKKYIIDYSRKYLPQNQVVQFVSQVSHETHSFVFMEENLNYTAERLSKVYPKLFPPKLAARVVASPDRDQIIANTIYANRMGNGDFMPQETVINTEAEVILC